MFSDKDKCYSIFVIGAGGTGSYFLKEFSRYLYDNEEVLEKIESMSIFDGDEVEAKNLKRQAFMEEDIGIPKSVVMASALNEAFSLEWFGRNEYILKPEQLSYPMYSIPIVIGCVDNHACRLVCEEFFNSQEDCIYFDAANEFSSGEVVFAVKENGRVLSPVRSTIFPDVLEGDLRSVEEMSCTELNEAAPQHITANMYAGLILLSAMTLFFGKEIVKGGVTVFDAEQMDSQYYPMGVYSEGSVLA